MKYSFELPARWADCLDGNAGIYEYALVTNTDIIAGMIDGHADTQASLSVMGQKCVGRASI
jgi:hypothetical protein